MSCFDPFDHLREPGRCCVHKQALCAEIRVGDEDESEDISAHGNDVGIAVGVNGASLRAFVDEVEPEPINQTDVELVEDPAPQVELVEEPALQLELSDELVEQSLPPTQLLSSGTSSRHSRVVNMHSYNLFNRYGKTLWLVVESVPIIVVMVTWTLWTDHGCADGKRNLNWYQWFYDFIYTFFGVMTAVLAFDVCYLTPSCSNWSDTFRPKFWFASIQLGMATCVALNLFARHLEVYTSAVAWIFGKSIVVFSSTMSTIATLLCAIWHTSGWEEKKFAVKSWILVYLFALWAFVFYICNQFYVEGYLRLQSKLVCSDELFSLCSLYDYMAACFFTGAYVKMWGPLGHWIMSLIRESAPPLQKDRLHFVVVLWCELFCTAFGRIIFREVHLDSVLLILMIKDSVVRVMDLTLRYNPTRIIRMAIREESDDESLCLAFWERAFALFLDVDLRLTLELLFGFRSHSHHCHHLPDEAYMSARVKEVLDNHHHHLHRHHWQIARLEASPDVALEDPHDVYPPGTLHWAGAMRRWAEHKDLLRKHPFQSATSLDPGMRAIQWVERDKVEEVHEMHHAFWWHQYLCQAGLNRSQVKSYLAFVWGCDEWTADRDHEAEAVCDRMCFVQKNIRLNFVAIFLPKITSSVFGVAFLIARSHFPCTTEAYGLDLKPTFREVWIWCYLFFADALELLLVAVAHWRNRLHQDGNVGWIYVSHVLWDKTFMAMCVAISIHIMQDAMIASYKLDF